MKKRRPLVIIIYIAILALALSWLLGLFDLTDGLTDSEIEKLLRDGQVKSFVVEDGTITLKLHSPFKDKTKLTGDISDVDAFREEMMPVIRSHTEDGTLESYDFKPEDQPSAFDLVLPLLIVGLVLIIIWAIFAGRANAGNPMANFGKARTVLGVPDGKKVTFADVAGADEEKDCRRWWTSSGIRRNTPRSVHGFLMVCCWLALPVPVKPCWHGLWQAKLMCVFCLFPALILWKCM